MSSDMITGRTIVTTEWVGVPDSATTVVTYHAVHANQANPRHLAICGTFLADVDQGRSWDPDTEDACEKCAEQ
jgi:hypothetical protein